VAVFVGKRQEDVEGRRLQGQHRVEIIGHDVAYYMRIGYICNAYNREAKLT
jgi:hypothetical protein